MTEIYTLRTQFVKEGHKRAECGVQATFVYVICCICKLQHAYRLVAYDDFVARDKVARKNRAIKSQV